MNMSELHGCSTGTKDILLGVHGSGVNIEIGVDLDGRDVPLVSTRTKI